MPTPLLDVSDDPRIHVGDVGTELVCVIVDQDGAAVDISGASALTVYLTKPDRTVLTKTGALDTDGTDGALKYATEAGDLSAAGLWKIQAHVAGAGGWSGSSREAAFTVFQSRHGSS